MQESEPEADPAPKRRDRRRAALVAILGQRAEPILERVVSETLRATDFVGLGRPAATRYLVTARRSLPEALVALGAPDHERPRLFDAYARYVTDLVSRGVPMFVQRGLVSFGFRIAQTYARDGARDHGFDPDELEDELRAFQRAFEARLFLGG